MANVIINYEISDPENDIVNLYCEYDAGGGWEPATVLGAVNNINIYDSSLVWFSMYDLGLDFVPSVRFKITASDNDAGVPDTTLPMVVDNANLPYGANVVVANGEQNNIIPIELTLVSPALQPEEFQNNSHWIMVTHGKKLQCICQIV